MEVLFRRLQSLLAPSQVKYFVIKIIYFFEFHHDFLSVVLDIDTHNFQDNLLTVCSGLVSSVVVGFGGRHLDGGLCGIRQQFKFLCKVVLVYYLELACLRVFEKLLHHAFSDLDTRLVYLVVASADLHPERVDPLEFLFLQGSFESL